jgi:hypothetical protein
MQVPWPCPRSTCGRSAGDASAAEPYLNFRLDFDADKIAALASKVYPRGIPESRDNRALYLVRADAAIIDAATRSLDLTEHPVDAELLAPLVIDEILIRLLRSSMGNRIAQLARNESSLNCVATAIYWLRRNLRPAGENR